MGIFSKFSSAMRGITSGARGASSDLLEGTTKGNSIGSLVGVVIGVGVGIATGGLVPAIALGVGLGAACGIAGGAIIGSVKGAKHHRETVYMNAETAPAPDAPAAEVEEEKTVELVAAPTSKTPSFKEAAPNKTDAIDKLPTALAQQTETPSFQDRLAQEDRGAELAR